VHTEVLLNAFLQGGIFAGEILISAQHDPNCQTVTGSEQKNSYSGSQSVWTIIGFNKTGHENKSYKVCLMIENEMKHSHHMNLCLALVLITLFVLMAYPGLYATSLEENDYIIKDFGVKNGNLFITVEGTAGGSYDPSMGDEGYEAYVFDTDKGVFQVTVAEGIYNGTPYYLTDQVFANELKLNVCLFTKETAGTPHLENHSVQYVDQNANFTGVNKVYAIQVRIDDPDENCVTGEHINKIFSNQTKA